MHRIRPMKSRSSVLCIILDFCTKPIPRYFFARLPPRNGWGGGSPCRGVAKNPPSAHGLRRSDFPARAQDGSHKCGQSAHRPRGLPIDSMLPSAVTGNGLLRFENKLLLFIVDGPSLEAPKKRLTKKQRPPRRRDATSHVFNDSIANLKRPNFECD